MSQPSLTATYKALEDSKTFSSALPAVPADSSNVQEKTAFLSALRANASKLQGELNAFLTQKMEEDKAAEENSKKSASDQRAEDMYGEEDPEQDG